MKNLIIICLLVTTALTSQAQEKKVEDCDCPKPTRDQFQGVCGSIFRKDKPSEESGLGYKYLEDGNLYQN